MPVIIVYVCTYNTIWSALLGLIKLISIYIFVVNFHYNFEYKNSYKTTYLVNSYIFLFCYILLGQTFRYKLLLLLFFK